MPSNLSRKASQSVDELRRMHRFKSQSKPIAVELGKEMLDFFKQSVAKRQTKLEKLAESWGRLVPQILSEHCALESLNRGTLTVMVDSSSHLYELKQLLLSGLEQQLLIACKTTGLRKISLRSGRWYQGESSSDRKIRFTQ
jgi:Dna[CI] antecedent, DciA